MGADASKQTTDDEVVDISEAVNKNRMIAQMDEAVRNRVRGGIQYNMKIVLCGARGTGKTSLWNRFQGLNFIPDYYPTPEIQSATINWTFRNHTDHVKVEVWDVVDVALGKKNYKKAVSETGISDVTSGRHVLELLDSSVVDIYKDTQAVVFLVNPMAQLSLAYVREKYKEVPLDLSILILLNFKDLEAEAESGGHRKERVTMADIHTLCGEINAYRQQARSQVPTTKLSTQSHGLGVQLQNVKAVPLNTSIKADNISAGDAAETNKDASNPALSSAEALAALSLANADGITAAQKELNPVAAPSLAPHMVGGNLLLNSGNDSAHGFEVSLLNCFGLIHVHKFLDLPFLRLKRQTLLEQLLRVEADVTLSNTDLRSAVQEASYEAYLQGYNQRAKERAALLAANTGQTQQVAQQRGPEAQQFTPPTTLDASTNHVGSYVPVLSGAVGAQTVGSDDLHGIHSIDSRREIPTSGSGSDEDGEDYVPQKVVKAVKGRRVKGAVDRSSNRIGGSVQDNDFSTSIAAATIPNAARSEDAAAPASNNNSSTLKLSHDDTYEDMSVHKKSTAAQSPVKSEKRREKEKGKAAAKTLDVMEPPPVREYSQFELEVEAFKPNAGSSGNPRDTLEGFFDNPSDEEERSRIASKNRVRSFLRTSSDDHSPVASSPNAANHQSAAAVEKSSSGRSQVRGARSTFGADTSSDEDDYPSVSTNKVSTGARSNGSLQKVAKKSEANTPSAESANINSNNSSIEATPRGKFDESAPKPSGGLRKPARRPKADISSNDV